ncbi:hypothetical protein CPAST_c09390 [Clostridium pasteurianum DSM 525 = ATCC 6013]|uniref:Uncharacterized protein n=1 Tax=Clostridium pasteurianum DSM 525 = ATCC 6013 TaxID=1262449 RepID=A0A0H3J107_CLOPA|nr:hypothetical protein CPAST_c09390 [Clostridium pasteurianum DSM 525 = ATCC 6013]AJA51027.1 hypothetical protein CLPA_c09390 [Clostridium pasteurianum DSM 525 = ATCC 6013]KRU12964.1 hypothetical protein CP6013_02212 [Clostridium pasteurianum DSM 525 = ATCC 6013]
MNCGTVLVPAIPAKYLDSKQFIINEITLFSKNRGGNRMKKLAAVAMVIVTGIALGTFVYKKVSINTQG